MVAVKAEAREASLPHGGRAQRFNSQCETENQRHAKGGGLNQTILSLTHCPPNGQQPSLVEDRGVPVGQAARERDVAENVLPRWIRELGVAPAAPFPGSGPILTRLEP